MTEDKCATVDMNDINYTGFQREEWVEIYECPSCHEKDIERRFSYCPNCGKLLKW